MPNESATSQEASGVVKETPERELFAWVAPSRPFKRRDKDFYITTIAIAGIFGLILFLAEGLLPVILIISIVFLFYVMNTVEPDKIPYTITDKGIKVAGARTNWEATNRFWFIKRFDSQLLVVETNVFPGRLELVIDSEDKHKIEKILAKYIKHEEVSPSFLEKSADWLGKKMPGTN